MRRFGILLALSAIAVAFGYSLYTGMFNGNSSLVISAVLGIAATIGVALCIRRSRFAALWAAIDLGFLMVMRSGLGDFFVDASSEIGSSTVSAGFFGGSQWPMVTTISLLLLFQTVLELLERGVFQSLSSMLIDVSGSFRRGTISIKEAVGNPVSVNQVGDGNSTTINQFSTDVDSEIDTCRDLLACWKTLSAEKELLRIKSKYGDSLTRYQRFRVYANLGQVHSRKHDFDLAAEYYLKASIDSQDAMRKSEYKALSIATSGNHQDALSLSTEILSDHPSSTIASALRISCDRTDSNTSNLRSALADDLRDSTDTILSCTVRELRKDNFEAAESFAREGMETTKGECCFKEELARILVLKAEYHIGTQFQPEHLRSEQEADVNEAIQLISSLFRDSAIEIPEKPYADLLAIRGLARCFAGKLDDAFDDWSEAASRSNNVNSHIIPYAAKLIEADQTDNAIDLLLRAVEKHHNIKLASMLAQISVGRSSIETQIVAHTELKSLLSAGVISSHDVSLLGLIALGELESSLSGKVVACFDEVFKKHEPQLSRFARHLVLAKIALVRLNRSEADVQIALATLAMPHCQGDLSIRHFAMILFSMDRFHECAAFLDAHLSTNHVSEDLRLLLEAADKAVLDELALRRLSELRNRGVYVESMICREASLFAKYSAIDSLSSLLAESQKVGVSESTLKRIRYARSLVAAMTGMLDFVVKDAKLLPSAFEHHPKELINYTKVMRFGPGSIEAIRQLYRLIRKDRNIAEPQQAYIALFTLGDKGKGFPAPAAVQPGAAIVVKEDNGEEQEFIVEDEPEPQIGHREYSPDHRQVSEFIGKQVGDTILVQSGFQTTRREIKSISDKHTYLSAQLLNSFPDDFAETNFLFRCTFPRSDDGTLDLRVLGVQMSFWNANRQSQIDYYKEHTIPIAVLAAAIGRSMSAVWQHVAFTKGLPVRVIQGREEEVMSANKAMVNNSAVVLDSSAVMTLFFLGIWKKVDLNPTRMICPLSLLNDIWSVIADTSVEFDSRGHLQVAGEMPYFEEANDEATVRLIWRAGQFLIWLKNNCELVDSTALASVSPDKRRLLIDMFGFSTASAIAIAVANEAALWSDDVIAAVLARENGVSQRVWTLAVAEKMKSDGILSDNEFDEMFADMLGCEYQHFILPISVFRKAGEKSEWDIERFPLSGLIQWFANHEIRVDVLTITLRDVLRDLHNQKLLAHQEEKIFNAIFAALMRRPDGAEIAHGIMNSIELIFPLEVFHQQRARKNILNCVNRA